MVFSTLIARGRSPEPLRLSPRAPATASCAQEELMLDGCQEQGVAFPRGSQRQCSREHGARTASHSPRSPRSPGSQKDSHPPTATPEPIAGVASPRGSQRQRSREHGARTGSHSPRSLRSPGSQKDVVSSLKGTTNNGEEIQNALHEFSDLCVQLAKAHWGKTETGELPIKISSRATVLLRIVTPNNAARSSALIVIQKAFGSEEHLVRRLLNILERDVIGMTHGGGMTKSIYALELLAALLNLFPCGFELSCTSEITSHLARLMLNGLEGQLAVGADTIKLKPLRDLLMDSPLAEDLPSSLTSLISARLCSSKAKIPSNHWLWAAGSFAQEVIEIFNDPSFASQDAFEKLGRVTQDVVDLLHSNGIGAAPAPIHISSPDETNSFSESKRGRAKASPAHEAVTSRSTSPGAEQVGRTKASPAREVVTSRSTSPGAAQDRHLCGTDFVAHVMLEILVDFAGGVDVMIAKLIAMAEAELERLSAAQGGCDLHSQSLCELPPSLEAKTKKILGLAMLINGTFALEGVDVDALAVQVVPGLLRCILHSIDLAPALRAAVRPLIDLVFGELMVIHASASLWHMLTDVDAASLTNRAHMAYAAGCLSSEIEERLGRIQGNDPRLEVQLHNMRCLQKIVRCHLAWMQESTPSRALSLPAPCAPMTPPQGEKSSPKKHRTFADMHAPSSSSGIPSTIAARIPGDSDFDESEDVNTTSSESEDQDDNGSDLEAFIDSSAKYNPYGLSERYDDEIVQSTSKKVNSYLNMDLIDNYQDHLGDIEAHLRQASMPGPSNLMRERPSSAGSSPRGSPAKRGRPSLGM